MTVSPFNSPFELGIRMAFLLYALRPKVADLQKLVLLDYALVYSADLDGPSSLHTPVPQRNSEVFTRRDRIEEGLYLMSVKGVVVAEYDNDGIVYIAGPRCRQLVQAFTSRYARELEERARWVAETFGPVTSDELTRRFDQEGRRWGAEIGDLLN
ncbi:threonine transporter RhtB [Burkholderia pseudomallei]|uniref:ABC-three component system middle component 2 n=2 Tax=Burkholderia pseudomallei TaxID=28450 RepID=UPI00193E0D6A|nr:threonine transporter RhtB [Burkholderia pseudomallei]MBO7931026.1 threonine transporter RhtB [Burkholderia pseudomallei]QRM22856.1 threonine transporter RhtB [Burkholderia pseudomallei]